MSKLIAGPVDPDALAECNKWIAAPPDAQTTRSQAHSIQDLEFFSDERLIRWLKTEAALHEYTSAGLQNTVDVLRKREISWAVIGKALGVSRQAAWDRFS